MLKFLEYNISQQNIYSPSVTIDSSFYFILSGTWVGKVTLQKSIGSEFVDIQSFSSNVKFQVENPGNYRFCIKQGNYTSGTINGKFIKETSETSYLYGFEYVYESVRTSISLSSNELNTFYVIENANDVTISLPEFPVECVNQGIGFVKLGAGRLTIQMPSGTYVADSTAGGTIYNPQADQTYATLIIHISTQTKCTIVGAHGLWITT